MTDFEVVDPNELEFKRDRSSARTPAKRSRKASGRKDASSTQGATDNTRITRGGSHSITQASEKSQSEADDYKPQAGKPRIYEVVIETWSYTKSGAKCNYSHKIKYPGWNEFFNDDEDTESEEIL
jgi:hypothetical protein